MTQKEAPVGKTGANGAAAENLAQGEYSTPQVNPGTIRERCEYYQRLGLVTLPAVKKQPVSIVLDANGQPARNADGTVERWKSFQSRFPTDAEWERAEWHRATGLVLIIGPATWQAWHGLWVFDIEAEHRAAGEAWLDTNAPGWREGVAVETGGGGLHVYFLHAGPVQTDPSILWGEIRGRAAICVLPPSIHPATGRAYRFLSERWTNLPSLDPKVVPGRTPEKPTNGAEPIPSTIAEGERNHTLTSLAGSLRHRGLDASTIEAALLAVNQEKCRPPLPDDEIRRIAQSVGRYDPAPEPARLSVPSVRNRPTEPDQTTIINAVELLAKDFPEPRIVVTDILLEGTTLFAGRPKIGKSWYCLGLAIAVSSGGYALGNKPVDAGDVLYLALEDGQRRLQGRIRAMLGDDPPPSRLSLATNWRASDQGGLVDLDTWLAEHPDARLVIVDTLKRFRPSDDARKRLYDLDYESLGPLTQLAQAHRIAIVVVHHTRKMDATDPLDLISGSTGLTGAVDGAMILKRERGQADAVLHVTHRDMDDQELALMWDAALSGWRLAGPAIELRRSKARTEVLELLNTAPGGLRPLDIARTLGKPPNAVKVLLFRMMKDGEVRAQDGRYTPIKNSNPSNYSNPSNPSNPSNRQVGLLGCSESNRESNPNVDTKPHVDAETEDRVTELLGLPMDTRNDPQMIEDLRAALCPDCGKPLDSPTALQLGRHVHHLSASEWQRWLVNGYTQVVQR